MTLLVLRVCLVAGATLLTVGTGTTSGVARTTALASAVVLAVLAAVVRAAPTPNAAEGSVPVDVIDPATWSDPSAVDPSALDPSDPSAVERSRSPGELLVGRADDGVDVILDARSGLVVIGHGAVAEAVFLAAVAALCRGVTDPDELRVATADDLAHLGPLPGTVRRSGTGLDVGIAVAAVVDAGGARLASVVLVPDLGAAPRRDGPTVDVTRYGCVARTDPRSRSGQRIRPSLLLLEPSGAA